MSQQWKPGDTVAFTLTGRILQVSGDFVYLETPDNPILIHHSHIIGTPEQAKRERIMATLRQEFSAFGFEPMPNSESHFMVTSNTFINPVIWEAIQRRITELETTA